MATVDWWFERVKAHAQRTGPCPVCGRSVKRYRTFEMTVSPFNRHKDGPLAGQVRTRPEVIAAIQAEASGWTPAPSVFTHQRCLEDTDDVDG